VAFDGARVFRYKIYAGYKGNREHSTGEGPYDYLQPVVAALAECGIPCIQISKYEADDVLCSLGVQFGSPTTQVVIGTRDKDANQYLSKYVNLYDSSFKPNGRSFTEQTLLESTGFSPRQYLTHQLLTGDKIDNIPRLLTPVLVKKNLLKYGSFRGWKENDKAFAHFVKTHQVELKLNRQLVELVPTIELDVPSVRWSSDKNLPAQYLALKSFANPRSKGLF
jgi:5'-3' exonuclease